MSNQVVARFVDPATVAAYLGENVGTHYSAALRAAEAYGRHLAAIRGNLLSDTFEGERLGNFWRELLRSEQIRIGSPNVIRGLSSTPSHYFSDFLDTADAVYSRNYENVPPPQRKKLGHTEHAKCLRLLRDHQALGMRDRFAVQNKITTWMQLLRIVGGYQE
jgi:hypothetical protein